MGVPDWRQEWAEWVTWSEGAVKVLRRKTHVNVRRDIREAWSKRELKVKELININKWKGVVQKYLKKPFSSGDKRVLLIGSEAEGDRELIWKPEEVKEHLRLFFEAWMGKGIKLWFNTCGPNSDELHPLFCQDTDGRSLRRALVRGTLGVDEERELQESVPEFCREVLGWWRRKEVGPPGQRRELCEEDYLVNGVMLITAEDWER